MTPNKKLLKTHIALVEDDETLSATIHKYLSSIGFNVSCFNSAEAFEDYLNANEEFQTNQNRQRQPGIVLLDIRLKGMSGISFFHRLNDNHPHFTGRFVLTGTVIFQWLSRLFVTVHSTFD